MTDELPWETWVERRERWRGVRFTHAGQAVAIAELFNPIKWTISNDSGSPDGPGTLQMRLTMRSYSSTGTHDNEIVINKGDFVRSDGYLFGGSPTVVPKAELYERMEPEPK
jgi:hypothetical protein